MNIRTIEMPINKYNLKCPYGMTPKFIIVHNTANNAPAKNEINYMINNNSSTSFHVAVDDKEVIKCIPFNRNSWNCGDGTNGNGNRNGISIEICYSTGDIEQFKEAEKLACKYIASLLKEYGWGIDKVKKHQDFNGKYCPHKTLDLGWNRFLNMIKEELGDTPTPEQPKRVLEWQKVMNKVYDCGLAEDNSFGPDSRAKATKYYLHYKMPTIKNEHVRFIQEQLKRHGYNVAIDSSFGPDCESKVKQFQSDHSLEIDGFVGADTTRELLN